MKIIQIFIALIKNYKNKYDFIFLTTYDFLTFLINNKNTVQLGNFTRNFLHIIKLYADKNKLTPVSLFLVNNYSSIYEELNRLITIYSTQKIFDFLEKNNLIDEVLINSCEITHSEIKDNFNKKRIFIKLLNTKSAHNFLMKCFLFSSTKEKDDFWFKINLQLNNIIANILFY